MTNLAHSRQKVDVCRLRDFRSEACSARVSGQTRAIFRQKLRCAGCWVKSGEFLSESKQSRDFLEALETTTAIFSDAKFLATQCGDC